MFHSTVRRGLGYRAKLGCRRILPFGHTVDLVVEEHYIDIHISSDGVDEVVSAYGQCVTVTARLPYAELRIRHLDTGSDGCSTAVNTVETVCIHIIRKS